MMQLARRASLVVVVLVLTSVGTASAECAWVLWQEEYNPEGRQGTQSWTLESAFQTRQQCDGLAAYLVQHHVAKGATDYGGNFVSGVNTGSYRYVCIPDTIDPRGPKGGTR
jgi:hypothetical protein